MVWVVIGLSYAVDVVDVVDEVEVEGAVWDVCGHGIVLAVSREVDAVADAAVDVVAAVDVAVVNTARDTSWLLGKSNRVNVYMCK